MQKLPLFVAAALMFNGCGSGDSSGNVGEKGQNVKTQTSPTQYSVDCSDPKSYDVEITGESDQRTVLVAGGNTIIATVAIPNDVKYFRINKIQKSKGGFEMIAEWGGWQWHYDLIYEFSCRGQEFFFSKLKVHRVLGKDPGPLSNWESKEMKISPPILMKDFAFNRFLGDD